MTFRVGQKVVCIDEWPPRTWMRCILDAWDEWRHPYSSPIKGGVYTVTNIYQSIDQLCLELAELTDADPNFWGPGFYACGFRPIVERKTDISVFEKMLIPRRKCARTDA